MQKKTQYSRKKQNAAHCVRIFKNWKTEEKIILNNIILHLKASYFFGEKGHFGTLAFKGQF